MLDLKVLTQAVGDLEEEDVMDLLNDFVATNPSEAEAQEAVAACQGGMAIVGDLFEKGEYFVGDLIFAGELLTEAINVLKPVLGSDDSAVAGTIIIGTVHGDLHDIGKNIFKVCRKQLVLKWWIWVSMSLRRSLSRKPKNANQQLLV